MWGRPEEKIWSKNPKSIVFSKTGVGERWCCRRWEMMVLPAGGPELSCSVTPVTKIRGWQKQLKGRRESVQSTKCKDYTMWLSSSHLLGYFPLCLEAAGCPGTLQGWLHLLFSRLFVVEMSCALQSGLLDFKPSLHRLKVTRVTMGMLSNPTSVFQWISQFFNFIFINYFHPDHNFPSFPLLLPVPLSDLPSSPLPSTLLPSLQKRAGLPSLSEKLIFKLGAHTLSSVYLM